MSLLEKIKLIKRMAKDCYGLKLLNNDIVDYLGITNKDLYIKDCKLNSIASEMLNGDVYVTVENILRYLHKRDGK